MALKSKSTLNILVLTIFTVMLMLSATSKAGLDPIDGDIRVNTAHSEPLTPPNDANNDNANPTIPFSFNFGLLGLSLVALVIGFKRKQLIN